MEFPLKPNKSIKGRGDCCVANCGSKKHSDSNLNLSFHEVPDYGKSVITRVNLFGKNELVDKRTEWLRRLKVKDSSKTNLLVCSRHFTANDYYLPGMLMKLTSTMYSLLLLSSFINFLYILL